MYKIYIDTSKRRDNLLELRKYEKENLDYTVVAKTTGDFDLISELDKLLKQNDICIQDIEEFVPNLGPGSFTGLKNGVTVCNVLNWSLGKKTVQQLQMPHYGAEPNIQR